MADKLQDIIDELDEWLMELAPVEWTQYKIKRAKKIRDEKKDHLQEPNLS